MRKTLIFFKFLFLFISCYCQTEKQKQILRNFIKDNGIDIISFAAHPFSNEYNFDLNFFDQNSCDLIISYVDPSNNNYKFSCSYYLSFTNGYLTGFYPRNCNSLDAKCFSFVNNFKDLSFLIAKAFSGKSQQQQKSIFQEIQDYITNTLKQKLEKASCDQYCLAYLAITWLADNYNTAYNSAVSNTPRAGINGTAPQSVYPSTSIIKILTFQPATFKGILRKESHSPGVYQYLLYLSSPIFVLDTSSSFLSSKRWEQVNKIVIDKSDPEQDFEYFLNNEVSIRACLEYMPSSIANFKTADLPGIWEGVDMTDRNLAGSPGYYAVLSNDHHLVYFYSTPDLSTKRNAHFAEMEIVHVLDLRNDFGYLEFTNKQGQTTKGWIRMQDLDYTGESDEE